jgi:hypothetical protein
VKPLPLLFALCALALVGGFLLVFGTKNEAPSANGEVAPAPLPPSFEEEEEAFAAEPPPPLLEDDFVPADNLLKPVETFLAREFQQSPVFQPVSAEELIRFVSEELPKDLPAESRQRLVDISQALGIAPTYQPLSQSLITLLAGEVRGYVSPGQNLLRNNFDRDRPPEQAALINLLTRRLLQQQFPAPSLASADVDEILGHQLLLQTFAFLAEKNFRETLPSYPPSLEENIRESILLGLPSFFHELANFSEFHLAERLSQPDRAQSDRARPDPQAALTRLAEAHRNGLPFSHLLLAYPEIETVPAAELDYQLGPISLYLLLLEATDIPEARSIALALRRDRLQNEPDTSNWRMTFDDAASATRAADLLENALALRTPDSPLTISRRENQITLNAAPKP